MWGLGALRDGAAGLVKQGAGAVKHGVEAGAKMLENLDEVRYNGDTPLPSLLAIQATTVVPNTISFIEIVSGSDRNLQQVRRRLTRLTSCFPRHQAVV